MAPLEKAAAFAGLALPLLAAAWFTGSAYVEFSDRLAALEAAVGDGTEFRQRYEREQVKDSLVNEQVSRLAVDVEWLKFHHHDRHGGRAHTD